MKIKKAPLLFFICLSLTTLSCDNGESDSSINNLSDFAKEFVSTHVDSYNSMNIGNDTPFSQLILNALNVVMLMMLMWTIHQLMEKIVTTKLYKRSIALRLH